jgi:hypothetical protein
MSRSTCTCMIPRMGNQTIYVRQEDQEIWDRAVAYAKANRMPMSGLIMAALERYLEDQGNDTHR